MKNYLKWNAVRSNESYELVEKVAKENKHVDVYLKDLYKAHKKSLEGRSNEKL